VNADRSLETARYEVKMTCAEMYLPDVRAWIKLHPEGFIEAYPPRQVNTLYFDTYALDSFVDHLNGTARRSKLRFRWYGQEHSAVHGTLELKYKENSLGWKASTAIPGPIDLTAISWQQLIDRLRDHAAGAMAVHLCSRVRPSLLSSYVREYYESIDLQIRVTVDHDHWIYDQLTYPAPNLWFRSPSEGCVVVEVKASPSESRRVSGTLSHFPLRAERHSKYLNGVMNNML
jgi:hypothetical protein